jgi:hypothetical protein
MRFFTLGVLLLPSLAYVYVGPGLGAGTIGALLAIVGAIFLALFTMVYYPGKRARGHQRSAGQGTVAAAASDKAEDKYR